MYKPLSCFIGLRYTRAKRRNQFISFITLASILSIALSVTALITVLSVMNGLAGELTQRLINITTHATITGKNNRLDDWRELEAKLSGLPDVLAVAPAISEQAMINAGRRMSAVILNGILPEYETKVSDVGQKMLAGKLTDLRPGSNGVILGADLAGYLGITLGDQLTIISPQVNSASSGITPKLKRFTVIGMFRSGLPDFDRNTALLHIDDAANFLSSGSSVSALKLKLDDLMRTPEISQALKKSLPNEYEVRDWTMENQSRFQAIKTEKKVMTIILMLMVIESAFNIVAALVMLVKEKRADIAILKTLGLTSNSVMGIFMVLGTALGVVGTLLGTLGGVVLATHITEIIHAIESVFRIKFLSDKLFYISEFPAKLLWTDVYTIAGMAFMLTVLATIYPARQAAKVHPAEDLRYE